MNEALAQNKLSHRIAQDPRLPKTIAIALEKELVHARDVGYVISKIEILRDILAEVGLPDSHNDSVNTCLERMNIAIRGEVKSLRHVGLHQIDALIKHLGLMKAKLLTISREDPFITCLNDDIKDPLPEKLVKKLENVCHYVKPELILESLYGVIIDKLATYDPSEDDGMPSAKLRDYIYAYHEDDESGRGQDLYSRLDEEILVKHAASCFKNIVSRFH